MFIRGGCSFECDLDEDFVFILTGLTVAALFGHWGAAR
jgi:hypothetical protein